MDTTRKELTEPVLFTQVELITLKSLSMSALENMKNWNLPSSNMEFIMETTAKALDKLNDALTQSFNKTQEE